MQLPQKQAKKAISDLTTPNVNRLQKPRRTTRTWQSGVDSRLIRLIDLAQGLVPALWRDWL
jgi:hypothetical protein